MAPAVAPEYNHALHEHFGELISAFSSTPLEVVRRRLDRVAENPGSDVAEAWNRVKPQTAEEVRRFYEGTDSYIYDLAVDHCQDRRGQVWQTVVDRVERLGRSLKVLVYGDGIGTDSIALAQRGHRVTYFDLPGLSSRFAQFRFDRSGLKDAITALVDNQAIPRDFFEVVICIEVLEHLPDPVTTMKDLVSYARVGGKLLLTESFGSVGPDYPSHLPSNAAYAGRTCHIMERFGVANTFYSKNPVNYPMEFTKVRPGLLGDATRIAHQVRRALDTRIRRLRAAGS